MEKYREIKQVILGRRTIDGAGVKLTRIFSHDTIKLLDPFLLLDNFGSDKPEDYLAGFPWHPHRGIETITYMKSGEVDHEDSLGNKGTIRKGDVQWMTAGSGIIHQEMPQKTKGVLSGFQLWVNLPAKEKMCKPRYNGILASDIPELEVYPGVKVKVLAGSVGKTHGPVKDLYVDITYLDFSLEARKGLERKTDPKHTAFAYVYEGDATFGVGDGEVHAGTGSLLVFGEGDKVGAKSGANGAKFLLVTGKPLREPVAWGGPIVMNTEAEIKTAFSEIEAGTFIKVKPAGIK